MRENGLSGSKLKIRRDVAAAASYLLATSAEYTSDAVSASTEFGFNWSARPISRSAPAQFQSNQSSTQASAAWASANVSSSSTPRKAAVLAFGYDSLGARRLVPLSASCA